MKRILILFTLIMILNGCSVSPFTGDRVGTLKLNMPQNEALSIAGNPDSFETLENNTSVYKYMGRHMSGWNNYFTNYYLFFKDEKLISIRNDDPWIDTSLADNLEKINQSMQIQQENINNEQIIQQNIYNDFQQKQEKQRQYWQQQNYQQQQLELDRQRNRTLNSINNQLIFSK